MEKNHENNEMTLEKLATLTQKGFIELEEKLEQKLEEKLEQKLEQKLAPIKNELKDFKNEMSGHMDHIYGVLKDIKEENTMGYAQYKRHDEKLINHENRLVSLESKK